MMKIHLLALVCCLSSVCANAQLTAGVSSTNASCNENNGTATATPAGAVNYTYLWSNGATTAAISNLAPGTYTVTVYGTVGSGPVLNNIYTENFQGPVTWAINVPTGVNEAAHNIWAINDTCGGVADGDCSGHRNGNKTLHVHATYWFEPYTYIGALYNASAYSAIGTNLAAQSPAFSISGAHHLILAFDYIGNGEGMQDVGSCYYSLDSGATFVMLDEALKSPGNCNENLGIWAHKSYTLPASCNNVNNFVLRFNWQNDDDGVGSDPAIGIDNIVLGDSTGNNAGVIDSVVHTVTISTVNVRAFFVVDSFAWPGIYYGRNESTGDNLRYRWAFGDGTYYDGCCPLYAFQTAGFWSVCLTVTDPNGCTDTYCDSTFYAAFKTGGGEMTEFNVSADSGAATAIQALPEAATMEIFPNPANNQLNIVTHNFQPLQVIIYDLDGKMVLDEKYAQTLDIKTLSAGLYFIQVKNKNYSLRSRFLKMQ